MSETSTSYFAAPQASGNWLWRAWQALTMPIFYPLFGVGCLWILVLALVARVRFADPAARAYWLRERMSRIARSWLRLGSGLGLLQHDVVRVRPDLQPGSIVIANHPSLVDVVFVLAELPQLCCVLKSELGTVPVLGSVTRVLNYLSNADPEHLLREGQKRLEAGESLLIFPEGTRTKGARALAFKLGAVELALRTGAPVQPVVIHYHGRYLSGLGRWYQMPRERLHYTVEIPEQVLPPSTTDARQRRALRPRFRQALERGFEARLNHRFPGGARFFPTARGTI